jgi:hypothetical protein
MGQAVPAHNFIGVASPLIRAQYSDAESSWPEHRDATL